MCERIRLRRSAIGHLKWLDQDAGYRRGGSLLGVLKLNADVMVVNAVLTRRVVAPRYRLRARVSGVCHQLGSGHRWKYDQEQPRSDTAPATVVAHEPRYTLTAKHVPPELRSRTAQARPRVHAGGMERPTSAVIRSADGARIEIWSDRVARERTLFITGADGKNPTHVITQRCMFYPKWWSPDGLQIAYPGHCFNPSSYEILVVQADGPTGSTSQITPLMTCHPPGRRR